MRFHDARPAAAAPVTVPARGAIPEADRWDLSALYPDDAAWEQAFTEYQALIPGFEPFRNRVGESAANLVRCLEFQRAAAILSERLGHYATLRVSEDGAAAPALERQARLQAAETRAAEAASFILSEINAIPDGAFATFEADPAAAPWRNYLRRLRRHRPHTLPAPEERLLALGAEAVWGHGETFSQLTNVDLKFGSLEDGSGRLRELSQSTFSSFLQDRDHAVRKRAFHQFYAAFDSHKFALASMLANSIRAGVFHARARKHASARDAALFQDDVPPAVYDNLIATVRGRFRGLHGYFEFRRSALGLDKIHFYDTYVPIVADARTRLSFDEAAATVLDSLAPMGEEYTAPLREGLGRARWCDRYENRGKRSGAFSSSSYGNPPYILMNYKEDVFSDLYTLAHEAGHSMHTWFAQSAQPFQDYNYAIFVAEVASTFNEQLLTHHLLATRSDPAFRAYVINRQIDDIRATLFRQTMFAAFERAAHAEYESGGAVTLDRFRAIYRGLLDDWFGPDFTIDPELELECLRIPHFYSAFYVYKYATGLAAAIALAHGVLSGKPGAREAYLAFLKSGGSLMPLDALRLAGVDMAAPDPVASALDLFETRVAELKRLL